MIPPDDIWVSEHMNEFVDNFFYFIQVAVSLGNIGFVWVLFSTTGGFFVS